jgi:queuine tRNA-ribosyltransferase
VVRAAVDRSALWAARARAAHRREGQALFGIVQGGIDPALRTESAQRTVDIGFDGYGIGGLSVGEDRAEMLPALDAATAALPSDRPRYLMGVGDPVGLVEGIARGVDMFDCVLQTRLARHATVLTSAGRFQLRNVANARSDDPLDPTCGCAVCARWSRAYLRHLFQVNEPTGPRLVTLHNLAWTLQLLRRVRASIADGTFTTVRDEVHAAWGDPAR